MRNLAELVNFEVLLARDAEAAARDGPASLQVRDETLAPQLSAGTPHERLSRWTQARLHVDPVSTGHQAAQGLQILGWILAGLGSVLGASAASALLAYDGQAPINVLAWLLYTAMIPFALACVLGVGLLLPPSWWPRAGFAQAAVAALATPLLRRLTDRTISVWLSEGGPGQGLQRWLWVGMTQVFTLGYLAAAATVLVVRVATSDLAFSWGTTLQVDDGQVAAWVRTVGTPWASIWPGAVPDPEAVAASNYSRFVARYDGTDQRAPVPTAVSAAWWQFSLAAILTYGVLPRLALAGWSRRRWRGQVARWPDLNRPEVQVILQRLGGSGGFIYREGRSEPIELESAPELPAQGPARDPTASLLAVAWGAAAADPHRTATTAGLTPDQAVGAGASLDLSAEERALQAAARHGGPVVVLMPEDEPPIEDVLSFLRELRTVAPRVFLRPVRTSGGHPPCWETTDPPAPWLRALRRIDGVEVDRA